MALQDIKPFEDFAAAAEFEAGLTKLMPFLRVFARSLSGKAELAEDLAQEALAKALRSRLSFKAGTNLKAWLCAILRHEYYSHQRRAWRQIPLDAGMVETICAPPGEQLWTVELSDTARAMQRLSAEQREALILVGVGGFSYKDAAVLSRSAEGTVKSRVGRARQALRDILDSHSLLPINSRSANGNAMNEILAQLSQLSRPDATVAA